MLWPGVIGATFGGSGVYAYVPVFYMLGFVFWPPFVVPPGTIVGDGLLIDAAISLAATVVTSTFKIGAPKSI